ncbi:DUF5392 family protein [Sediminibacillus halophilus]|uniref:Uncharacterized protein n=1 Tax=Sediminibacillus halophilus TaxID=482461 RepID=A0A1G9NAW1_9BACI|nr:DUF5392 family protein [Sediminibacillus halophilus]SDL83461.1 hypothetical protein SAMN05216244_0916 [Sediminibacillus halophilus]
MNNFMFQNMPGYIQHEIEGVMSKAKSLIKKNTIFTLVSIPLIVFSVCNLFILLYRYGAGTEMVYMLLLFALLGSIGIALYKEAKMIRKEIRKVSSEQIMERIEASDVVNDYQKRGFIETIKKQPVLAMSVFIQFLQEEKNRKENE